ncbi:helix-turn-helix transcriptional regulator [Nocardiopsis alba]|uniref:helix-turn-helix domain-containing protein n=1 Tax=Nocardiopsis alba TaxID=53437 RepID=UPI003402548E
MPPKTSPAELAAAKQFGHELRRMRTLSDMSQLELGRATGTSKQQVGAIERGNRRPSKRFTQLADEALKAHGRLQNLWPGAKRAQPWWLEEFVELEAKAQVIYEFQPQAIPGLLQSEDYARAVIGASFPPLMEEEAQSVFEDRMARQQLFNRVPTPLTLFIIDEGALRRRIGGAELMRKQLASIVDRAQQPRVQVQVLPFERGAHSAMNGPLVLLDMSHAESLVYAETPGAGQVITDAHVVGNCQQQFGHLRSLALSPDQSLEFITSL